MTPENEIKINDGIEEAWTLLDSFTTEQLCEQCMDTVMELGSDELFFMLEWSRKRLIEWWILHFDWDGEDKCWRVSEGIDDA